MQESPLCRLTNLGKSRPTAAASPPTNQIRESNGNFVYQHKTIVIVTGGLFFINFYVRLPHEKKSDETLLCVAL